MRVTLITLCLAIGLTVSPICFLYAQITLFPNGYIITLQGDTINGIISTARSLNQFSLIQFKKGEDSIAEELTPTMIRGYSLFKNHRVFVSHTFPKDDARVSLAYFLDALVLGKASLFMGKDSSEMVYFFL